MTEQPLAYALIRFRPYPDGEEFANIGVVLVAPESGYLDFRLETARLNRVTAFFDTFDQTALHAILSDLWADLERVRKLADGARADRSQRGRPASGDAQHLFGALTKTREGVLQFSSVRYALHADPEKMLDELFDRYVSRTAPARTPATA